MYIMMPIAQHTESLFSLYENKDLCRAISCSFVWLRLFLPFRIDYSCLLHHFGGPLIKSMQHHSYHRGTWEPSGQTEAFSETDRYGCWEGMISSREIKFQSCWGSILSYHMGRICLRMTTAERKTEPRDKQVDGRMDEWINRSIYRQIPDGEIWTWSQSYLKSHLSDFPPAWGINFLLYWS